jgi:hypothetical protein
MVVFYTENEKYNPGEIMQLIVCNVIYRIVKNKNFIPKGMLEKKILPTHPRDH